MVKAGDKVRLVAIHEDRRNTEAKVGEILTVKELTTHNNFFGQPCLCYEKYLRECGFKYEEIKKQTIIVQRSNSVQKTK